MRKKQENYNIMFKCFSKEYVLTECYRFITDWKIGSNGIDIPKISKMSSYLYIMEIYRRQSVSEVNRLVLLIVRSRVK